jgi:hypothetical protein
MLNSVRPSRIQQVILSADVQNRKRAKERSERSFLKIFLAKAETLQSGQLQEREPGKSRIV